MSIQYQLEQEEKSLEEALQRGEMTPREFDREINDLHRDAHAALEEEAQRAYDNVMNGGW